MSPIAAPDVTASVVTAPHGTASHGTASDRTAPGLDPTRRYRLHDRVALRDEPFGALAYHYGNRKLVFLKNRRIVDVVRSLDASASVDAALDAHGVAPSARANYLGALSSLLRSDMLVEVC